MPTSSRTQQPRPVRCECLVEAIRPAARNERRDPRIRRSAHRGNTHVERARIDKMLRNAGSDVDRGYRWRARPRVRRAKAAITGDLSPRRRHGSHIRRAAPFSYVRCDVVEGRLRDIAQPAVIDRRRKEKVYSKTISRKGSFSPDVPTKADFQRSKASARWVGKTARTTSCLAGPAQVTSEKAA